MVRSSVVFPAPLLPRTATTLPSGISIETPRTAWTPAVASRAANRCSARPALPSCAVGRRASRRPWIGDAHRDEIAGTCRERHGGDVAHIAGDCKGSTTVPSRGRSHIGHLAAPPRARGAQGGVGLQRITVRLRVLTTLRGRARTLERRREAPAGAGRCADVNNAPDVDVVVIGAGPGRPAAPPGRWRGRASSRRRASSSWTPTTHPAAPGSTAGRR